MGLLAVLADWALSDSGRLLLNRGRRPDTAENGTVKQWSNGAEERWNGRAVRREKWAAVRAALDVGEDRMPTWPHPSTVQAYRYPVRPA